MVSILIITYNRPADLLDLLNSINTLQTSLKRELIDEVLILNNRSTVDYSTVTHYLEKSFTFKHRFITAGENLGVAKGRNFLVQQSRSDFLLFLDDDIVFTPFDLQLLLQIDTDAFFKDRNTGIITYHIRYFSNNHIQPSAFPHKKLKEKKHQEKFFTYYFTGAAHLLKRKVFEEAGYYPIDFFYGMEEYDLSYRVIEKGYAIGYSNAITFLHKESPLGRKSRDEQYKMMWINKAKVAYRYLPVIYFYTTSFLWSLYYLKQSGFNFSSWLNGYRQIFNLPTIEKRRRLGRGALNYLKDVDARLWY